MANKPRVKRPRPLAKAKAGAVATAYTPTGFVDMLEESQSQGFLPRLGLPQVQWAPFWQAMRTLLDLMAAQGPIVIQR